MSSCGFIFPFTLVSLGATQALDLPAEAALVGGAAAAIVCGSPAPILASALAQLPNEVAGAKIIP
jgi:hypothetical protein